MEQRTARDYVALAEQELAEAVREGVATSPSGTSVVRRFSQRWHSLKQPSSATDPLPEQVFA